MEAFAEKLKASATQAAMVAQNLAMTGFDEMAATDAYVQSEGFNVAVARSDPRVGVSTSFQNQLDLHDDTSTLSTHSSAWFREAARNQRGGPPPLPRSSSYPLPHDVVPLKVSVPERQSSMPNGKQEDSNSVLSSDNEHGESSDEDDDDPIMSMIRKKHVSQQAQLADGDDDDESSFSERHLPTDQRRKKTHRFMEDLESRMAMPEEQFPPVSFSGTSTASITSSGTGDGPMLVSWLSAVVGRNARQKNAATTAPLARNKRRLPQQHQSDNDGLGDVEVVSSTAMLGDAEMLELAQFRQQSTKCGSLRVTIEILQRHPRELFIIFTLLLGSFAYFYSSNRSLED
jgi:hypothetical protein